MYMYIYTHQIKLPNGLQQVLTIYYIQGFKAWTNLIYISSRCSNCFSMTDGHMTQKYQNYWRHFLINIIIQLGRNQIFLCFLLTVFNKKNKPKNVNKRTKKPRKNRNNDNKKTKQPNKKTGPKLKR